jgi:hypothetical protein
MYNKKYSNSNNLGREITTMIAKDITYTQIFKAHIRKAKMFLLNLYKPYQWAFIGIIVVTPFLPIHGSHFNPVSVLLMLVLFEMVNLLKCNI